MRIFSCVENLVAAARLNSDPTKSRSHGHPFNCNAKKYHIPDSLSWHGNDSPISHSLRKAPAPASGNECEQVESAARDSRKHSELPEKQSWVQREALAEAAKAIKTRRNEITAEKNARKEAKAK